MYHICYYTEIPIIVPSDLLHPVMTNVRIVVNNSDFFILCGFYGSVVK